MAADASQDTHGKMEAIPTGYPKAKSAAEKGKAAMSTENMERRAELQRQIA